jgi:hypothetical protein
LTTRKVAKKGAAAAEDEKKGAHVLAATKGTAAAEAVLRAQATYCKVHASLVKHCGNLSKSAELTVNFPFSVAVVPKGEVTVVEVRVETFTSVKLETDGRICVAFIGGQVEYKGKSARICLIYYLSKRWHLLLRLLHARGVYEHAFVEARTWRLVIPWCSAEANEDVEAMLATIAREDHDNIKAYQKQLLAQGKAVVLKEPTRSGKRKKAVKFDFGEESDKPQHQRKTSPSAKTSPSGIEEKIKCELCQREYETNATFKRHKCNKRKNSDTRRGQTKPS